jgi:CBS domain containing-hemolysin-like protein
MDAMDTLNILRTADVPMAFVHDEYGHFEGLVTPTDLLAALSGSFVSDRGGDHDPPLVEREDGSWWVSGSLPADALSDQLARLGANEVAMLDERMGAFRGRIARDRLVEQACYLAEGDTDGFEAKFGRLGG